jgi:transposase
MGKTSRRQYDSDFKLSAVRLVIEDVRKIREVAMDLMINENMLGRWRQEFARDPNVPFPFNGHLQPDNEEFRRL